MRVCEGDTDRRVAVSIGPQYGTVGPDHVREAAIEAGGYFDLLVICGFAFDARADEESGKAMKFGKMAVLTARMNPDLAMADDLLKKALPNGLHGACLSVYTGLMLKTSRVNVILDEEHAVKLRRLADRTHTNPGTIARSLLSTALEEAEPDPRNVTDLLDRIPGAFERAQRGAGEARSGLGMPLEDL
jgi:hypothetical protein